MRQYIELEGKRLLHCMPEFFFSILGTFLFVSAAVLLAKRFVPDALEIKSFQVGLCVEGTDRVSEYVREYVRQMESTGNLIEFVETDRAEAGRMLEKGEWPACVIIPARTVSSIMDGSNIPVQVWMGSGVNNTERYLQKKLLTKLTECGAVLIDVPQAETFLLYELQVENAKELGMTLDFFHFGLVLDRADWFEKQEITAFGSAKAEEYYLAAGITLLLLFWGIGNGNFLRRQDKNLPLLLEKQKVPIVFQEAVRQCLFLTLYLMPITGIALRLGRQAVLPLFLLCVMVGLQCCFFFQLAPTVSSGIFLNSVWAIAGFFGAGGILPAVFLPAGVTNISGKLPAGICMKQLLQMAAGRRSMDRGTMTACLLWCLFFGLGGQLVFWRETWSVKRK